MRLNHLEIAGFKSFPERAELSFDDGVTAIVGPNGCGKSNVIDAITWVLGEQSARSLRGERMEDVIFSGSDARRPTAAAEVRIQLSQVTAALARAEPLLVTAALPEAEGGADEPASGANGGGGTGAGASDGALIVQAGTDDPLAALDELDALDPPLVSRDVEVGRRLYRSGESEYLIDGQVCRLRDIQDLLMDSGVGGQGLRGHRARTDWSDPGGPPGRATAAARGGGRGHEVQVAPSGGRAEARGRPTEPDAGRRHRLRGGEAADGAQAASRQGPSLSPAARGAATVGDGVVRATTHSAGAVDARGRGTAARRDGA